MEKNPYGKRWQEDLFCDSGCCGLQEQVIPGIPGLYQTQIIRHKSYAMVHEIKGDLNEERCTVQMNFAENFVSINGEEIQSAYLMTFTMRKTRLIDGNSTECQTSWMYTASRWKNPTFMSETSPVIKACVRMPTKFTFVWENVMGG